MQKIAQYSIHKEIIPSQSLINDCEKNRGGMGSEFRRVPDPGTQSLLPGRIRVVAGSGYVTYMTCDIAFLCRTPAV